MIEPLIAASRDGRTLTEEALLQTLLSANDSQAAVAYVTQHPDYSAYHLLFALRRSTPALYRTVDVAARAQVLCSALGHVRYLNDWGYLDLKQSHDGEAAQALLETGTVALADLVSLLDDQRPAPLFGSEEATLSTIYHYRRCDFAYRYAMLLKGLQPIFEAEPTQRDRAIAELRSHIQIG